jgi:N-acetylneuraminic acid mutarotase
VPSPRACHTMNKIGAKLYLFGGYDGTSCFNELCVYKTDSKTWSIISPKTNAPLARNGHTMTTKGATLILFGGHTGKLHLNDLWIFNIEDESWTEIPTYGNPPKGLRAHSSNLVGNRLFVFGGYDGTRRSNLMNILDLEKMKWDRPSFEDLNEAPTGRQRHSATLINTTKILLFGGFDGSKWLNDSYQIDVSEITFLSKQSQVKL